MAELYFKVKADYEQVIKLREEVGKLAEDLRNFSQNGDFANALTASSELKKCISMLTELSDEAARAGATIHNQLVAQVQQIAPTIQQVAPAMQAVKASTVGTASSIEELLAKLRSYNEILDNNNVLSAVLDRQRDAYNNVKEQVDGLAENTATYQAKSAELRNEIDQLLPKLQQMYSQGASAQEIADAQTEIRDKVGEYKESVIQASASAQASYRLQQEAITALQKEIERLNQLKAEASQNGNAMAVSDISAQIEILSQDLVSAQTNLAQLGETCVSTSQDFSNMSNMVGQLDSQLGEKSGLDIIKEKFVSFKEHIGEASTKVGDFLTGHGKFQESLQGFKTALDSLPVPLGRTLTGIKNMTVAMWKMVATPLGAVLAAIALALKAVFTWFNKSAEGQRTFAKISAYLGSILSTLTDVVMIIGEYLFHAFYDANGPLHDFAVGLKTTLVTAFKAVWGIVSGFGTALKGIFTWDYDKFVEGLNSMKDGFVQAGQAVIEMYKTTYSGIKGSITLATQMSNDKEFQGKIGDKFKNMGSDAIEAGNLAVQEHDAEIRIKEEKEEELKLDKEIAENREKIYHLTGKAKRELIAQTMALQKQKYDKQIQGAKELLDIQRKKNALHINDLDALSAERNARMRLYQLEAQQAASTRMLARMAASEERKASSKGAKDAKAERQKKIAEAMYKENELIAKHVDERIEQAVDMEEKVNDAMLEAMEEGAEKQRQLRDRELRKRLKAIDDERDAVIAKEKERQMKEYEASQAVVKAQGGTVKYWDDSMLKMEDIQKITDQYKEISQNAHKKYENDIAKEETDAIISFLKTYASYEEQRLAITKEYEQKIRDARTVGERASLEVEQNEKLKKLDTDHEQKKYDWQTIFSGLDSYSVEYLTQLKDRLQDMLKDTTLLPDQAAVIGERLDKVTDLIAQRKDAWTQIFGDFGMGELFTWQNKLNQAEQESVRAKEVLTTAQDQLNAKTEEELRLRQELAQLMGVKPEDVTTEMVTAQSAKGNISDMVKDAMSKWLGSKEGVDKAQQQVNTATQKNETAQGKLEGLKGGAGLGMTSAIIHGVNDNMQSLVGLMDDLHLSETAFGKGMKSFAESSQYATDAFDSMKKGDLFGTVRNLNKAFGSLGEALGNWGISFMGSSDKSLDDDIKDLTRSNDALKNALSGLTEQLKETNVSGAFAKSEQIIDRLEDNEKSMQNVMYRSSEAYNNGFLGIGGQSSSSRAINKGMSDAEWDKISKVVGRPIRNAKDFFRLSSDEMYKVMVEASAEYAHIKDLADDGYKDASQFMDDYVKIGKQIEAVKKQTMEQLTNTSFDSLVSDFTSAISDMSKTSADFANDFEAMMKKAVINGLISDKYKDKLKKWYEGFSDAMAQDGLSKAEQDRLRNEYMDYVNSAQAEVKAFQETMNWSNSASQNAQSKGFATMSQDTASELNGRFMAMQIAMERVAVGCDTSLVRLAEMSSTVQGYYPNIIAIGEGVLRQQAESYIELQQINERTEGWNKPMRKAFDNIEKMARKMETL